jgi:hypothetical protein
MKRLLYLCVVAGSFTGSIKAQVLTKEDSLNAGLTPAANPTVISGYGQAKVEYDLNNQTGQANLTRNVLFFGHRFNKKISFFSEMELENAKISNGSPAGEISMEQLFLKFNATRDIYITAGLFIPRLGIINENHLPTTFNGNDRTFVETYIIPATWRELGVGLYGNVRSIPGLNYSFALVNGLNAAGFSSGSGIREGRFEGSNATASNLAVTGALLYYVKNFRIQASGYYGGSCGLAKRVADSLQLQYGAFGTAVALSEANIQYINKGLTFKALGTVVSIPDADKINRAYANNTPRQMMGAYAELGYNILRLFNKQTEKNLTVFGRYEYLDMNAVTPENGIVRDDLKRQYIVAGITFQPVKGVSVKADFVNRVTGEPNQALIINPYPTPLKYYTNSNFINLGIGYSF